MTDPTSEDHANRAELALLFYTKQSPIATHCNKSDELDESDVSDLISDLLHLCNRMGFATNAVVRNAKSNFLIEFNGG